MKQKFILLLLVLIFGIVSSKIQAVVGANDDNENKNPWKIDLVSEDEPGQSMIVTGTVYGPDGETPLAGIKIHVYHTDARGYYSIDGQNERQHRINGTMTTNSEGKYEYLTIKPASYPNSRIPAHVHYQVSGPGYESQRFELQFQDDPFLSQAEKEREANKGRFAKIVMLEKDENGVLRGELNIKMQE